MSWMVASCDCLFKFIGGALSMLLDISCGLDRRMSDGGGAACVAHLMTRTDQPRLSGCALSTASRSALFSGVSVLESLTRCYVDVGLKERGAHLRSQVARGRPSMRQGSTRRRTRAGRGRGHGRPRRRRGCTGRERWGWESGGCRTRACQPRACQPQALEISAARA